MIPGVFTTYSPLLKKSLHLPIPFSYYPLFVYAMDERKEKKDFCFVSWKRTLRNQTNDSQYKKMHRCSLIAKGLETIEWFCWVSLLSRLVFFGSFIWQALMKPTFYFSPCLKAFGCDLFLSRLIFFGSFGC
jgi:hypothetical protein